MSDDISLMRASLGKFKKALLLTHSGAFSSINDMQRSINDDALLPPEILKQIVLLITMITISAFTIKVKYKYTP